MMRVIVLIGILTWYAGPYVAQPLRCGGIYDISHDWIAVDIDVYHWQCDDLIRVDAAGETQWLPLLDSGLLSRYCVETGEGCIEIVGDVPGHAAWWTGLSAPGRLLNVSAARREFERRAGR